MLAVNDDGTNDCVGHGGGTNTAEVTEAFLRGLACDADTVFRWDNPADSPDAGALDCATAGATVFPWDFGISTGAASELPVLNGIIGGVLDAAGQRALVAFARVNRDGRRHGQHASCPGDCEAGRGAHVSLSLGGCGGQCEYHGWRL